jgi:hypothetical protein
MQVVGWAIRDGSLNEVRFGIRTELAPCLPSRMGGVQTNYMNPLTRRSAGAICIIVGVLTGGAIGYVSETRCRRNE